MNAFISTLILCVGLSFSTAQAQETSKEVVPESGGAIKSESATIETGESEEKTEAPKPKPTAKPTAKSTANPKPAKSKGKAMKTKPTVIVETSLGNFEVQLNSDKTPKTVENFLKYVEEKFFDGTIFHRVIKGFMIQGGGFTADMNQKKTHDPIKNEAKTGGNNKRGTIAMARTSVPDSATAQFFINTVDNQALDYRDDSPGGIGYAVFGEVSSGMDVVDKIESVSTTSRSGHRDVPAEPVTINSIKKKN